MQNYYHNCFRLCLAEYLGIPIGDVPYYLKRRDWVHQYNVWLKKTFGLRLAIMQKGGKLYGKFIVVGPPLGGGLWHACIYQDDKLIYDPRPHNRGLKEKRQWYVFYKEK